MAVIISAPNLQLPWSSTLEDDRRLYRIILFLLIPFFLFSVAIPLVNVPEPDRKELEKLPPQLAKVVLEKQELPKPPPPKPKPKKEEKKKEEKKPEEPTKEEKKPEAKPEPKPEPEPAKLVEQAREVAAAEINQFADALMDMRDDFDLSEVNADELTQGTGEAAELDRAIISSQAKAGSGGINTQNLSRDTGGVALSGKESTRVKSKIASRSSGSGNKAGGKKGTGGDGASRSEEEIRKTMDRHKSSVFAIYNRALRSDPTLEGKVVIQIVIEPSGQVSSAKILSSDLNSPDLENKILARIKLINFGAKAVGRKTLNYTYDFLPY